MIRACEWAENQLELSGVQKNKWSVSTAGGRQNGNGVMNGQNLPLKIRSTVKPLKVKSLKSSLKVTIKLSVRIHYYFVCCVTNKSDYLAKEHHFNYAALWSGYVKRRNHQQLSKPGTCKSLVTH